MYRSAQLSFSGGLIPASLSWVDPEVPTVFGRDIWAEKAYSWDYPTGKLLLMLEHSALAFPFLRRPRPRVPTLCRTAGPTLRAPEAAGLCQLGASGRCWQEVGGGRKEEARVRLSLLSAPLGSSASRPLHLLQVSRAY